MWTNLAVQSLIWLDPNRSWRDAFKNRSWLEKRMTPAEIGARRWWSKQGLRGQARALPT
jgi:hypothetical protein